MDTPGTKRLSPVMLALRLGLIFGALGIVYQLIMFFTKQIEDGGSLWGLVLYLITGIATAVAIKRYRNTLPDGKMSFGKAFSMCFQVYIYAGIIYSLFTVLLVFYISPETAVKIFKNANQDFNITNNTGENAEATAKVKAILNSPLFLFIKGLLSYIFIGLIASFIVAPICKREDEVTPASE